MISSPRVPWWVVFALTSAGVLMLAVFLAPRKRLPVLPRAPADQEVVRVAYIQTLAVDPHRWTFPLTTQNQFILSLWEPLIECDPETGQPQPAAAAGWRWSDDRLTLTVSLRPDGRWSNGEPVTAHDFVRSWRRLIRQDLECATALFPIRHAEAIHRGEIPDVTRLGVEAVDDLTLRIHLHAVRSSFVAELSDPLLVPLHASSPAVLQHRLHLRTPQALVGNGAFRLTRAGPEGFRLEASPYYRDRTAMHLRGVEFVRADNAAMARLLVAVGRVDIANPPARGRPQGWSTERCVTEATEMAMQITTLDLNQMRGPLRDVRVRRALALAVDRAGVLAQDDTDRLVPAYAWVPDMPGRPSLAVMRENADEARRLLAEAGYPGGKGLPVFVLPVNPRRLDFVHIQAWTERWYRELGVRTYLAYDTPGRRKERMDQGDFDITVGGLIATVPDAGDLLSYFAYPERFNARHFRSPAFTALMIEANRKAGAERLALLERLEREALDEVISIPMMFERRRTLLAMEVEGWYADPLGRQALRRLAIRPLAHGEGWREDGP